MQYKRLGRLMTVVLLSSLGLAAASHAKQPLEDHLNPTDLTQGVLHSDSDSSSSPMFPLTLAQNRGTEKVGEYQSHPQPQAAIAKIESHRWNQRPAATLYVRNLPILTFIDPTDSTTESTAANNGVKVAGGNALTQDPVWRATSVAAQLNQFYQGRLDANTIKVRWDSDRKQYIIQAHNQELIALDQGTVLPNSSQNSAQDALQATNRLRRQMGNAMPLKQVEGQPRPVQQIARNPVRALIEGLASWYGPGFHGAQTASGERFNQHSMTAAHRTLPFGTQVRVTNANNGRSVVVRINDRGPFTGGRVIDLSMAAAQAIGMVSSGVAPVEIEVLSPVQ